MTSDENIIANFRSLSNATPEVVLNTLRTIGSGGKEIPFQAIKPLIELLDYPDSHVRRMTAQKLGQTGQADVRIIEALLEATLDKDRGVKSSAIGSLGLLMQEKAEKDPDVIERLIELTFDKDEQVREKAAVQLGNLELRDNLIVSRLVALLRDREITVRGVAIDGLAKVGNKSHIPLLKKFINSEEPIYDIYDSNLVTKAKNAYEQVWDREG